MNIQSLIFRSFKTTSKAFLIATAISGAIASIVSSKDNFTFQLGGYASLISIGCGAIFNLVASNKPKKKT